MLASLYNPKVQRGGTWAISISAKDVNNSLMDFSVYNSMRMHLRPAWVGKPGSIKNAPLLILSTATGEIVVNTTTITITLSAAVTAGLAFDSAKYELEMVKDAVEEEGEQEAVPEIVDKLLYGTMQVTGEIVV